MDFHLTSFITLAPPAQLKHVEISGKSRRSAVLSTPGGESRFDSAGAFCPNESWAKLAPVTPIGDAGLDTAQVVVMDDPGVFCTEHGL